MSKKVAVVIDNSARVTKEEMEKFNIVKMIPT